MVNLTIRLSKSGAKPEHNLLEADETSLAPLFVDANLPVVKGIGFLFPETCRINFVGSKVQPKPGAKVHICLMCNFPIAVYGRLDPCQHVLCYACAKSDSTCFLCKEKVVRIQKVDVLVGIFICGVPGCLRSFLVRPDFELHVAKDHSQHQSESTKGVSLGKPNPSQIQTTVPRKDDSKDERLQRRRNNREPSKQGQKVIRENSSDQAHEAGQNQRDRGSETGPSRKRERERGGHPHCTPFQSSSKHGLQTGSQQTVTLPPPPPYPLPLNYPAQAAFPALNSDQNGATYPPHQRDQFYLPRPDATVALHHSGPGLVGLQQQQQGDQWPRSFVTMQEGFGTNGFGHMRPMQGHPRPQLIFPEFGLPMSMGVPLMSMPRFHEGLLPPPPPGPPPQQSMFNALLSATTGMPSLGLQVGELIVDYGWRPGNSSNQFGGPRGGN